MIQAVILAGGKGTRLEPLTHAAPKPLVLVRGKPFLHHQLERLRSASATEVLLLTGYLGGKIMEYFGDGSKLGLRIEYSQEKQPLGTAGALKNAESRLRDDFLLMNGDTLLHVDYEALVALHGRLGKWGLVIAFENPERSMPNNLAVAADGRVMRYQRGDGVGLTHVDAGVAVFSRRVLDLIPAGRFCSLEEEIYPRLIDRGELWAYASGEPFYDMGTFAGIERLEGVLNGLA